MRKSKKRVIAFITCCFILATLCVGVFADETTQEDIDPAMNRVGTVLTTSPYDLGNAVYTFNTNGQYVSVSSGYYIMYINPITFNAANQSIGLYYSIDGSSSRGVSINADNKLVYRSLIKSINTPVNTLSDINDYYIYVYVDDEYTFYTSNDYTTYFNNIILYSISNTSVIDNVYSNSQDVNSSIVDVINEATNVITTNDVVMMFCILIPVISFGVGILIRLRKRA